ncbi:MAG: ABC transporter permease [Variibacter sp.]
MSVTAMPTAPCAPLGGRQLKQRLRRVQRRQALRAFALLAPLMLFLAVNFLLPITLMFVRSVEDPDVRRVLPRTLAAISDWDGRALPSNEVGAALLADLGAVENREDLSRAANRLNYDINGFRTLIFRTARSVGHIEAAHAMQALGALDPRWKDVETWGAIKRAAGPTTSFYLLGALDMKKNASGEIHRVGSERAVFTLVLARTLWISFCVTLLCLLLGYPVAYLLATIPSNVANILMILVLLPFWTSLLVRTTAWVVLLQTDGPVNGALRWLGLIDQPLRLIFNRVGVYIAITHVLLPFMVLPLYSVMKSLGPTTMRAAISLGAHPFTAFLRVYVPQTMPGVFAGTLLVFVSSIGYYITPALIGGADDQMLSYFIAFYTNETTNWGLAGALGVVLLAMTAVLYLIYSRLAGGAGPRWT